MQEVAWVGPLPSQPGLVAFECESCLYVTSEILPPVKGAFREGHRAGSLKLKIFSRPLPGIKWTAIIVIALGGLAMGGGSSPPLWMHKTCEPLENSVGTKLAMTDIFPATLMLGAAPSIWGGIAWLERID